MADKYEKVSFLEGDPSCFLRRAKGAANQEAGAFIASALSFGARSQFIPRIQWIFDRAGCEMDAWVRTGAFERDFAPDDTRCFYRFYTYASMNAVFRAYRALMERSGTLGEYVRAESGGNCQRAVEAICRAFGEGAGGIVPINTQSACKRVCMFLRWMVRSDSPVDLGLWSSFMDRRTLVIPLDTHVVQEARRLGLLTSPCATMSAARRLTAALAEVFPDDPCRGDFALFGLGVDDAD